MGDGIYGMLSRDEMCEGAKKYWDFYNMKPGAGFYQREFGFYSLEKWRERDGLDESADLNKLFGFDPEGARSFSAWAGARRAFSRYLRPRCLRTAAITSWFRISRAARCCASRAGATALCPNMWIIRLRI